MTAAVAAALGCTGSVYPASFAPETPTITARLFRFPPALLPTKDAMCVFRTRRAGRSEFADLSGGRDF